jgi:MFS transporter, MFS domain-containing protein family, molybdate-anion transporter
LTLLWTVFESWMVTEYNARGIGRSSVLPLGAMFGTMTTANCINAILAGVVGHYLVLVFGSKTHPFILGVV